MYATKKSRLCYVWLSLLPLIVFGAVISFFWMISAPTPAVIPQEMMVMPDVFSIKDMGVYESGWAPSHAFEVLDDRSAWISSTISQLSNKKSDYYNVKVTKRSYNTVNIEYGDDFKFVRVDMYRQNLVRRFRDSFYPVIDITSPPIRINRDLIELEK